MPARGVRLFKQAAQCRSVAHLLGLGVDERGREVKGGRRGLRGCAACGRARTRELLAEDGHGGKQRRWWACRR